jgi:thimet oligopeptidase
MRSRTPASACRPTSARAPRPSRTASTDLGQQFNQNIRDDKTKVAFTLAELAGCRRTSGRTSRATMPPGAAGAGLPELPAGDGAGRERRGARAHLARQDKRGRRRQPEAARRDRQLRREYAQLFGFKSFADFQLRRRMAENTANTQRFLDDVRAVLTESELRDLGELRQAKADHLKQPLDQTKLERWDVPFYTERVRRERYTVDQEAFRRTSRRRKAWPS